jgi:hypothetical protein
MGIMTKEEIMEMAQECKLIGLRPHLDGIYFESLEAFAKLVAEKEREACIAHAMTSAEKAIDVAIKLEREACATIVDEKIDFWVKAGYPECAEVRESMNLVESIRNRGQE